MSADLNDDGLSFAEWATIATREGAVLLCEATDAQLAWAANEDPNLFAASATITTCGLVIFVQNILLPELCRLFWLGRAWRATTGKTPTDEVRELLQRVYPEPVMLFEIARELHMDETSAAAHLCELLESGDAEALPTGRPCRRCSECSDSPSGHHPTDEEVEERTGRSYVDCNHCELSAYLPDGGEELDEWSDEQWGALTWAYRTEAHNA